MADDHYFYEMLDKLSERMVCQVDIDTVKELRNEYPPDRVPLLPYAWTIFWEWWTK